MPSGGPALSQSCQRCSRLGLLQDPLASRSPAPGAGAYDVVPFGREEIDLCRSLIERFADQQIGLADASVVVTVRRYGTADVLTLDERHFRVLPGPEGRPLRILPADRDGGDLETRAAQGDREAFDEVLGKVPDVAPEEEDQT